MFKSFHLSTFAASVMEREKFLEKVTQLFFRYGAKTLTMDDIAREFSISKKTLYQHYSAKEEILSDTLSYILENVLNRIEKLQTKYENPLLMMLNSTETMEDFLLESDNVFYLQLIKYYPEIIKNHQLNCYNQLKKTLKENTEKGKNLGYYKTDFNEDLYFKFVLQLFFSVEDSPLFTTEYQNKKKLSKEIIEFYTQAIVTENGARILKELKEK